MSPFAVPKPPASRLHDLRSAKEARTHIKSIESVARRSALGFRLKQNMGFMT